jgi:hypothetical protein
MRKITFECTTCNKFATGKSSGFECFFALVSAEKMTIGLSQDGTKAMVTTPTSVECYNFDPETWRS